MLGSFPSMFLRLRTSALVVSVGIFALAACASSEPAEFDTTEPEPDAGADVKKPDADSDADDGTGGAGGDGGEGGAGGGPEEPDPCGLASCPDPTYPDFFKCCTSGNACGFKNGPSGFCYDAEDPNDNPGAGGGP